MVEAYVDLPSYIDSSTNLYESDTRPIDP